MNHCTPGTELVEREVLDRLHGEDCECPLTRPDLCDAGGES